MSFILVSEGRRCQVTPMGGYKTSSIEVLVLLAICYSTVISGISNNYIYVITCVSVINSGNTTYPVAVLIVYFLQIL